jgi:type IV pilus assembly protein PilC
MDLQKNCRSVFSAIWSAPAPSGRRISHFAAAVRPQKQEAGRMKKTPLTGAEVSALCLELSVLVHAGVGASDALRTMEEETQGPLRPLLAALAEQTEQGRRLSEAMESAGVFPGYAVGLLAVGERAGRTEEALSSLAAYYDARERLTDRVRSALLYPAVLLVLMLVVIGVLLIRVLPVFAEVYASLGGQMTGVAGGLLALGRGLDAVLPALCVLLALTAGFLCAFAVSGGFRERVLRRWRARHGGRGVTRSVADARFARAMSMCLRSGLSMEEALDLAGSLQTGDPAAQARCADCARRLQGGAGLADALRDSGALPPSACRLVGLGVRSGSADTVMEELARRLEEKSADELEEKAGRVEPTLVIVTSVLVGVILLSVMLPLMNIMAAVG